MSAHVRVGEIASADWSVQLGEIGAVVTGADDVAQCIRTLIACPKGSVPHHPHFGCDAWAYLGRPLSEARPQIVREVVDAVERWERRAEVRAVVVAEGDEPSAVIVTVTFRLRDLTDEDRTVSVRLPR